MNHPVYPVADEQSMNMLEYFAAHAPSNIPSWFEPQEVSPKPTIQSFSDYVDGQETTEDKRVIVNSFNDYFNLVTGSFVPPGYGQTISEEAVTLAEAYSDLYFTYQSDLYAWTKYYEFQKLIQWRWYYAAGMIVNCPDGIEF